MVETTLYVPSEIKLNEKGVVIARVYNPSFFEEEIIIPVVPVQDSDTNLDMKILSLFHFKCGGKFIPLYYHKNGEGYEFYFPSVNGEKPKKLFYSKEIHNGKHETIDELLKKMKEDNIPQKIGESLERIKEELKETEYKNLKPLNLNPYF